MKIKDFLNNFTGDNRIEIYDEHDFKTYRFQNASHAKSSSFAYFSVKEWNIVDGVLKITIRSQF